MWKVRKITLYEIVDERNNHTIVTGLKEDQAHAVCEVHNVEVSKTKWNNGVRSVTERSEKSKESCVAEVSG